MSVPADPGSAAGAAGGGSPLGLPRGPAPPARGCRGSGASAGRTRRARTGSERGGRLSLAFPPFFFVFPFESAGFSAAPSRAGGS